MVGDGLKQLAALHAKAINHCDPRMANAVNSAGKVKWIDFLRSRFSPSTTTGLFTEDMTTLVGSLLSVRSLISFLLVAESVKVYGNADFSVLRINAELTDCM